MWPCVKQTMSLVRAKCGHRPMAKQTFNSGIWQTVTSPATEYPRTWTDSRGIFANFWTRKLLRSSDTVGRVCVLSRGDKKGSGFRVQGSGKGPEIRLFPEP